MCSQLKANKAVHENLPLFAHLNSLQVDSFAYLFHHHDYLHIKRRFLKTEVLSGIQNSKIYFFDHWSLQINFLFIHVRVETVAAQERLFLFLC